MHNVARYLKAAKSILFITGAGMSADSGLPTYRGLGGLYEGSTTEDGIPIEMALAGAMLVRRPEVTWKYLSQIEQNCRHAAFNTGHAVIAEMEKHFPRVWTLTQNIDGFHTDAGSRNVIEIHGNLRRLRCDACGWRKTIRDFTGMVIPPICPECHAAARPDVVLFGENLSKHECELYETQLACGFDMFIWIGTTCVFPYIQRPLFDARRRGGITVEINPGETEISGEVDVKVPLRAAEALKEIWAIYQK